MKRLLIAGIAVVTVPGLVLAQKEKEKDAKEKEKKEVQHITIVRNGDLKEKTVIEIEGDRVKVNGKDVKDNKDVNVSVSTHKGATAYRRVPGSTYRYSDDNAFSIFSEDDNRAMLGVVTEGSDKGVQIQSVTDESAADKAGLKKGDILTRIGDKKIESTDDVTEAVRSHKPGDKVNLTYLRDGKEQKATAELGKWKGIKMNAVNLPRMGQMEGFGNIVPGEGFNGTFSVLAGRPRLGLSIQDSEDGKGVTVLEVEEESNAAKAGIKKDDIILSVDDKDIKGTEDITRALRENREKYTYNFKIQRAGKTQNIEVKMPRKLKTADL